MKLFEFVPLLRFDVLIFVEIKNHKLKPSYTGKASEFFKWPFYGAFYDAKITNIYIDDKRKVLVLDAITDNAF